MTDEELGLKMKDYKKVTQARKIFWDGHLPIRRYAMFTDVIRGDYLIVIRGEDIDRAEKLGGFVSWVGGVRKEETRDIKKWRRE